MSPYVVAQWRVAGALTVVVMCVLAGELVPALIERRRRNSVLAKLNADCERRRVESIVGKEFAAEMFAAAERHGLDVTVNGSPQFPDQEIPTKPPTLRVVRED